MNTIIHTPRPTQKHVILYILPYGTYVIVQLRWSNSKRETYATYIIHVRQ